MPPSDDWDSWGEWITIFPPVVAKAMDGVLPSTKKGL